MQGIRWLGLFFLDMFLPFGLRSAPFIFTSLMDLFVWACITLYNFPNLSHFVDDFIYVALLEDAFASYERFQITAASFGVPFKPSKFVPPSPKIEYIGFLLDAPSMTISLPLTSAIVSFLLCQTSLLLLRHRASHSCVRARITKPNPC
jgi:hypothetical protein